MVLQIKDLRVDVDEKEILRGVSLEVKGGEVHAIMGPNGSGKSTLAYTLMGHPKYKVTSGGISLKTDKEEIDILSLTPSARAKLGIFLAFQYPVAVEGVSVQLFLWKAFKTLKGNIGDEAVKNIVGFKKFNEILDKYCSELDLDKEFLKRNLNDGFSGGERKKLEILQMMVFQPKVIILDETDSGTDVDAMKRVASGVNKYLKENKKAMIIIITHYNRILNLIKPKYVHIIRDGLLVESGNIHLAGKIEQEGYETTKFKINDD